MKKSGQRGERDNIGIAGWGQAEREWPGQRVRNEIQTKVSHRHDLNRMVCTFIQLTAG